MTLHRSTSDDTELTNRLRAHYAAPTDTGYWDALEARIMARIARGDDARAWWGEFADLLRPGLVAAAALILVASMALVRSHQLETRSAYTSVIAPSASALGPVRAVSVGDGDNVMHSLIPR